MTEANKTEDTTPKDDMEKIDPKFSVMINTIKELEEKIKYLEAQVKLEQQNENKKKTKEAKDKSGRLEKQLANTKARRISQGAKLRAAVKDFPNPPREAVNLANKFTKEEKDQTAKEALNSAQNQLAAEKSNLRNQSTELSPEQRSFIAANQSTK